MNSILIGLIAVFFFSPPIALDWKGGVKDSFSASFDVRQDPCAAESSVSGFNIKYRYKVLACKSKVGWRSDCGTPLTEIHEVKYDPIVEKFKVAVDRLNDGFEPRTVSFDTKEEALQHASRIEDIKLSELQAKTPKLKLGVGPDQFVRIKLYSECKGKFQEVISWVPYILTFGLIDRDDYDSGWLDFYLK